MEASNVIVDNSLCYSTDTNNDNECPICFENIKNNELHVLECCKQCLHTKCYTNCIAISGMCPMCRSIHRISIIVENPLISHTQSNTTCSTYATSTVKSF
jgi:hypothetical protein